LSAAVLANSATPANPMTASPPRGFVDSSAIRRWFGKGKQATKHRLAWTATLPGEHKWQGRKRGRFYYSPAAVLPDGMTVGEYVQSRPIKLSEAAKRSGVKQRQKELDAHELLAKREWFRGTDADFEREYRPWAEARGLGCSAGTRGEYRRKLARGEPIDGRAGRSGRKRQQLDEGLCAAVYAAYLNENDRDLTEVLRYVNGLALKRGKPPLEYHAVRRWLKRKTTHRERVKFREGDKQFEARCARKLQRDYESILAGDW
jgi:hypothetical protein